MGCKKHNHRLVALCSCAFCSPTLSKELLWPCLPASVRRAGAICESRGSGSSGPVIFRMEGFDITGISEYILSKRRFLMTLCLTSLSLSEARRHLKMNLSILEMLKGNTEPGDLSRLRQLWVEPYEELIRQRSEEYKP